VQLDCPFKQTADERQYCQDDRARHWTLSVGAAEKHKGDRDGEDDSDAEQSAKNDEATDGHDPAPNRSSTSTFL
jgi:hypothetical protein